MQNLHEAKNMALKARFMLQDRERYEPPMRNFGSENSRALVDNRVTVRKVKPHYDQFREEKAVRKQKVVEAKETPKPTNPYAQLALIKCFKCNQPDHHSSDRPFRKVVHLAEREEKDVNKVYFEPDGYGDDEAVYEENDDEGENDVVRKLMLTPKQEEITQCHQLFWTRCTISGKLFELIMDGGSCENLNSREAVRLLKLRVEKHPNPYFIGYSEKIEVNERYTVPFSIRKHWDEVYYDVVDMDAC